jgi:hypothetical protein
MFNYIKSFDEVQFKNHYLSLGMMSLINAFKSSCQTVLYGPRLDGTILVQMNQRDDNKLK